MVRSFFVILYICICAVITLPVCLILLLIHAISHKAASKLAQPFACAAAFRPIFLLSGARLRVEGRENIPKGTPVLFAGNHRSMYDILAAYLAIPRLHSTGFIAKYETRHVPFLSWWMRVLDCKFLNRTNPKEGLKTIQEAIEDNKKGVSMFIMPEGTRNHDDGVKPFKAGSLKISERTGCPVVPVAMIGMDDILEKHYPKIRATRVTVIFGEPIPTADMTRDEKVALPGVVRGRIIDMLTAHGVPCPDDAEPKEEAAKPAEDAAKPKETVARQ